MRFEDISIFVGSYLGKYYYVVPEGRYSLDWNYKGVRGAFIRNEDINPDALIYVLTSPSNAWHRDVMDVIPLPGFFLIEEDRTFVRIRK